MEEVGTEAANVEAGAEGCLGGFTGNDRREDVLIDVAGGEVGGMLLSGFGL